MSPLQNSCIIFVVVFGGALLGLLLHAFLPEHHLKDDTKDVVKLGMGLVATMTALVLGLLVASAKGSYDAQRDELIEMSADIVLLDRLLAHYGPESQPAREALRSMVGAAIDRWWSEGGVDPGQAPTPTGGEVLYDRVQGFSPQSEAQKQLKARALRMINKLGQTRWLMFEQSGTSIPQPFLIVVVFWLAILFASFGLFAPSNTTVVIALFISALSVSGALFLILEVDQPFTGAIQISDAPLRASFAQLGR